MYAVMKAIYDSGIPVNFKGSMVLKACLLEAGYAAKDHCKKCREATKVRCIFCCAVIYSTCDMGQEVRVCTGLQLKSC